MFKTLCILCISLVILSGCGVTNVKLAGFESHIEWDNFDMSTEEKLWQAAHIIDVLQTETYHREDCYVEANPITRRIIGKEPSTEKVLAWGAGAALWTHYGYQLIDNSNLPKWSKKTIKWVDVAYKYDTIYNNHQIGIRIGAPAKKQPNNRGYCEWQ